MSAYDLFRMTEKDFFNNGWEGEETSIVATPRLLLELASELDTAIFLNQALMYTCSVQEKKGRGAYFYKSINSWYQSIKIKRTRLERIVSDLEQDGLLETKVKRVNNSNTRFYRVNHYELWKQMIEVAETKEIDIENFDRYAPPWLEELDDSEEHDEKNYYDYEDNEQFHYDI